LVLQSNNGKITKIGR